MNLHRKNFYLVLLIPLLLYLFSCNGKLLESTTGTISVSVVDNDSAETPIPDVEITIIPGNIVKKTDTNGLCNFDVCPGDYYVDADVCCAGPGTIHYHEPVAVVKNATKEVTLVGCLICL